VRAKGSGETELKTRIESTLGALIGKKLWGSNRAADMEMFQFGRLHRGMGWRGRPARLGGCLLEVFPDEAPGGRYEHRRFLQPNKESGHFVVRGGGIEE
jgi:hypothetical protein